ncbi:MAG: hypothetical protein ACO3M2_12955 [Pseudohongiellaceae bacterium]
MATAIDKLQNLLEWCEYLHNELEVARKELSDEEFEAHMDGPIGEILTHALEVEDAWLQCNES